MPFNVQPLLPQVENVKLQDYAIVFNYTFDIISTGDQNLEDSNYPKLLHEWEGTLVLFSYAEQWDSLH